MLVLERFDELSEPVSAMCSSIERQLCVPVQAKLFATCRMSEPQGIWSDQDMIILQCSEQVNWVVHGYAGENPGVGTTSETTDISWTGKLSPGDALYLPQGWSSTHGAIIGPAVHIALMFRNPIGFDLACHALAGLASLPLRTACPRFGGAQVQSQYLTTLQRALFDAITGPGFFMGPLDALQVSAEARIQFGLPWSAMDTLPDDEEHHVIVSLVRFPAAGVIKHLHEEDAIEICHDRRQIRFHSAAEPLIKSLLSGSELTLRQFFDCWEGSFERVELTMLILDLARHNVVSVRQTH